MGATSQGEPVRPCSAVILAGGLNTRMGGRNKAYLKLGATTLLERILATLRPLFPEIIIATREPQSYQGHACRIVADRIDVRSSLTGVHAGLSSAREDFIFALPCDAPFLQPALIELLLGEIDPAFDVVVPRHDQRYEPLCAVYSRRCIAPIEVLLAQGDLTIYHLYDQVRLKTIPEYRIRPPQ